MLLKGLSKKDEGFFLKRANFLIEIDEWLYHLYIGWLFDKHLKGEDKHLDTVNKLLDFARDSAKEELNEKRGKLNISYQDIKDKYEKGRIGRNPKKIRKN